MNSTDPFDPSALPSGELYPHQVAGRDALFAMGRGLLADGPGRGKTATGFALVGAVCAACEMTATRRMAWFGPANVVPQSAEAARGLLPSLLVAVDGVDDDETLARADLVFVSIEVLPNRPQYAQRDWALVVVDEVHRLKAGEVTARAVQAVADRAGRVVGMTGTPYCSNAMELWQTLKVISPAGLPPEEEWASFLDWIPVPCDPFTGLIQPDRPGPLLPGAAEAIAKVMAPFTVLGDFAPTDHQLPELVSVVRPVPMTPPQVQAYEAAKRITNPLGRNSALERAVLFAGSRSAVGEEAVRELQVRPRQRAVIWTESRKLLDVLKPLLRRAGIGYVEITGSVSAAKRKVAVEAFRSDPAVRVLIGTSALEVGVDGLQVCDLLISLGSLWTAHRPEQRTGRIVRAGSPYARVTHLQIHSESTFEADKRARVEQRARDAAAVLTALARLTGSAR